MSKRQARRLIAAMKPGTTVKEFMKMCGDFGIWFDEIQGTDLETAYNVLYSEPAFDLTMDDYTRQWTNI